MAFPGASSVASESELEDNLEHQVRRTSHTPRCPSKDMWMEQAVGDRAKLERTSAIIYCKSGKKVSS